MRLSSATCWRGEREVVNQVEEMREEQREAMAEQAR
eukprot:CAMPEP_0203850724 /NCGR_PEP_ID=MMETSP0359-20131031/6931_1 /ASSEMBLY_ACC=CAM_ASM_000338 /TAXON_ID=268821 /ORGANISM="Scrippsiella Hangoei, Strain SHTV-5" /LENGTH=35 /DNA_ID= /DNA_START= /DNA_END= /DNA_ORIENTATION=